MHPLNHSINATGCPEFIAGRAPHTRSKVGEDLMLERALRPRAVETARASTFTKNHQKTFTFTF